MRLGFARVHGRSMEPTLQEGDHLLVRYAAAPRPGRLVVVRLPPTAAGARPLAVKRAVGRDPDDPSRWWVERDNPEEGVDSWQVGGIPDRDVVAVALLRLPRLPRLSTRLRIRRAVPPAQPGRGAGRSGEAE